MPSEYVTLSAALVLGFLHALEIDHMIAVTAFVSTRPAVSVAAVFGLRWGIGHSVAVLLVGGILLATGVRWPERYDALGEGLVGLMLIGIGIWAIQSARRLHLHLPAEPAGHAHLHAHRSRTAGTEGVHPHPHPHDPEHVAQDHHHHASAPTPSPHTHAHHHGHGITLVGLLHGLAGTTGVVALVPVTLIGNTAIGLGYLLAFGLGTILGMMLFAMVAAYAMQHAAERSMAWGRRIAVLVGFGGVAVGLYWAWNAWQAM